MTTRGARKQIQANTAPNLSGPLCTKGTAQKNNTNAAQNVALEEQSPQDDKFPNDKRGFKCCTATSKEQP